MIIIVSTITLQEIKDMATASFGNMVKGVIDVEKHILALNGEFHADEEQKLLEAGSSQQNLWGINIYPDLSYPDCIEFDSMINVRPSQGNMTRGVEDEKLQKKIISIVKTIVTG